MVIPDTRIATVRSSIQIPRSNLTGFGSFSYIETFLNYAIKMTNMKFEIDQSTYDEIARVIHSDVSPVGIDAKKTHILILNKLQELSDRLERMEQQLLSK